MFTLEEVEQAFPELADIAPIEGKSGQKFVYRCVMNDLDVVLKVFKKNAIGEGRTEREIAAVSKLDSRHVPRVHVFGRRRIGEAEWFYLIEQFIEGETLRQVLTRQPVLKPAQAIELLRALLYACADFEKAEFVHRDIKPENLIIDPAGRVWVSTSGWPAT